MSDELDLKCQVRSWGKEKGKETERVPQRKRVNTNENSSEIGMRDHYLAVAFKLDNVHRVVKDCSLETTRVVMVHKFISKSLDYIIMLIKPERTWPYGYVFHIPYKAFADPFIVGIEDSGELLKAALNELVQHPAEWFLELEPPDEDDGPTQKAARAFGQMTQQHAAQQSALQSALGARGIQNSVFGLGLLGNLGVGPSKKTP